MSKDEATLSVMESAVKNGDGKQQHIVVQNSVSHQDSGIPADEDLGSTMEFSTRPTAEFEDSESNVLGANESNCTLTSESNCTINSECNITVIHVTPRRDDNSAVGSMKDAEEESFLPMIEHNENDYTTESKDSKDGSDSGVEGCTIGAPRVPSRNSVDYASSYNGLDEGSCDSSLVSCCSVYEDPCATLLDDIRLSGCNYAGGVDAPGGGEGNSEGGSESSSIIGSISVRIQKRNNPSSAQPKKKLTTHGALDSQKTSSQRISRSVSLSNSHLVNGTTASGARAKPRTAPQRGTLTKSQSVGGSRDRGRARENFSTIEQQQLTISIHRDSSTSTRHRASTMARSTSLVSSTVASRSRARPDSLPSALTTEINKDLAQRASGTSTSRTRGGSTTRTTLSTMSSTSRTPGSTPSEDGRKSLSTVGRSISLYTGRTELRSVRLVDKITSSMESSSKALETYGTLPRTARHSIFVVPGKPASEKPPVANRSRSSSRDASNRLSSKKNLNSKDLSIVHKGLPPCPKPKITEKTRIYHEISVQTGLTGRDIDNCLAGVSTMIPNPESVETSVTGSQTEDSWENSQQIKNELKRSTEENEERTKENDKLKIEVEDLRKKLVEEQTDHAFAKQELDKNAQRVLAMLGTPQSEHACGSDSFLELESHFQSSGQVVASQQVEIADLQSLCRMLSRDLEKSLAAQKALLQQQQELEAESIEMQDFLQEEKATLETALKELESESKKKDDNAKQLSSALERQTEECKHLVRISEQRRQENLSLSMKLNAIERKSKELLLAQGAAASGALVALSGLGSRLEGLVDQLIISYNMSEKDLEDVVYHNEAFSRSNSSIDSSPISSKYSMKDCTPSPKRGSFVSAVIGAIRNAATHPFAIKETIEKKANDAMKLMKKDLNGESSSDLLDFETEPCLMMESVLEDVPLTDTYSHNMISSCDSLRRVLSVPESIDELNLRKAKMNGESSSLRNLTQAILYRRKVEDEKEENCESISESETGPSEGVIPLTDYYPATSLVDQVIDVDNLVTKLLKVLRIIQLDNDTCIQELKDEKTELETRLDFFLTERKADDNSQESEKNILSNGIDKQENIIENFQHVIKELDDVKELIVDGQPERDKCILEEPKEENQNANSTVFLLPNVCS